MSSILEKALTYLLNEEQDKAEQLFHQFIIERARQIHESLRQREDKVLDENWDQEIAENYFAEDDLADVEDDKEGEGNPFGGEGDAEADPDAMPMGDDPDAMPMGDPDADPDAMGADAGEGSTEDRIADLEASLEELQAQFDELSGTEETEHDVDFNGDGEIGGGEEGGEFGDAMPAADAENDFDAEEEMGDNPFGTDEEPQEEGFAPQGRPQAQARPQARPRFESEEEDDEDKLDEDEFDDITESIVNELEKVTVNLKDGNEIGTGKSFTQNNTSPTLQKKVNDRHGAKPVVTGLGSEHTGYERESSPGVKDTKFYSKVNNTKKHAEDGRERKTKEGDKSAMLNDLSSESGNLRSPIGSKGSVGKNDGVR